MRVQDPHKNQAIIEAKRLYDFGFGVHWIKPNSKAPVSSNWADGVRQDFIELATEYRQGYGLGVRLGAASRFPDGSYLANIDIDIKSSDAKHRQEALETIRRVFPIAGNCPRVKTGYGLRLFFRTPEPLASRRLTSSNDKALVYMPGSPVSQEQLKYRDKGVISAEQLASGMRVRRAWEIEVMSAGKQVVLPPSIHPDTKKAYAWEREVKSWSDIPLFTGDFGASGKVKTPKSDVSKGKTFVPVSVDFMDERFTENMTRIVYGEGVEDRSASAFSLSLMMVKRGFSDDEILTVLTDRDTFIGECAYDHRKTENRANAADWARDYCLAKARKEADAGAVFANVAIEAGETLTDDEARAQAAELISERDWKDKLKRGGKDGMGPIKPTLDNTLLILENAVGEGLFKRDLFAQRDSYGREAPWTGAVVGKMLTDDDAVAIKEWLARKWGVEPNLGVVYEAMTAISLKNSYHPVRDWLRGLPAWDGVARLDTWLAKHFEAEGPAEYLAQVFRKWLVASVTRVFEPGAKFDWLPILEGNQGVGKSSFAAILFGQGYFADWLPNLADKDAALGLCGKLCVEFGELDTLRRSELSTVKAFITRQFDIVRPPYGRRSVEFARGTVFLGTVDKREYLQDEAGNRRFNPVKVGRLDFRALARDREQLWAEALFIYDLGLEPSLYLENEAAIAAVEIQSEKQVKDDAHVMAELISDWTSREMLKPIDEQFDFSKFRLKSLFEAFGPLGGYKYEMKYIKLASKALKLLGFTNWKSEGNMVWGLQGPRKGPWEFMGPRAKPLAPKG